MLHVASKSTAAQELDLGSFETKIALQVAMPSKGLESKASPNKNWTWVASGTKFACGVLVLGYPRYIMIQRYVMSHDVSCATCNAL